VQAITQDPAQQRLGPLAALPRLVAELGADPAAFLAGTGLAPSDLRPDLFVSLPLFDLLLERAAEVTGRSDIGLQLGMRQSFRALGPIGRLMSHAPTLGDALTDFVTFQIANSRGAAAYLHRMGDDVAFGVGIYDREFRSSLHAYDLSIAVGCKLVRELTNGQVEPTEILLMRREPADPAFYRSLAHGPIRFNQAQCCLILPARSLDHRLTTGDPVARAQLLKELTARLSHAPWGMAGQVRHALRAALLQGNDSLSAIARTIGIHPRTLERHLSQEGTRFEAIKDDVRFTTAKELLALTTLPIGEVGAFLSYGSHSSFVHAFRRWAEVTPTQWRRNSLAKHEPK
jgi:AraC-like DNA-binding protein